jgi:hypothetical protein
MFTAMMCSDEVCGWIHSTLPSLECTHLCVYHAAASQSLYQTTVMTTSIFTHAQQTSQLYTAAHPSPLLAVHIAIAKSTKQIEKIAAVSVALVR